MQARDFLFVYLILQNIAYLMAWEFLTLKVLITAAVDDILNFFFFLYFTEKIRLYISCESSLGSALTSNDKSLFSLKNDKKESEYCLIQYILLNALKG